MPFPAIFITGTGTDVGKTIIASALLKAVSKRNPAARYWKPIQTGGQEIDAAEVRRLAPQPKAPDLPSWSYPAAASPDQAAIAANTPAPFIQDLLEALHSITVSPLVIEGAGGLLVPLNSRNETWRDFLATTNLPIVLVAQSGLGTLNHVLLTLEALDLQGLQVLAVILNGPPHAANLASLRRMRPDHRFHAFPQLNLSHPAEDFDQASEALLNFILAAPYLSPNLDWLEADERHCWHPYTQHQTAATPLAIVSAQGIYLTTAQGEKLIDASASWWTNSVGHGHPRVGAAIAGQQRRLDHCIFAQATHEPGSRLAQRLAELSEGHLDRVFYSDNGSCAVEIGLKIAAQSWQNQGQMHKQKFLFIEGSYHGDTFGAMSVGASDSYHKPFSSYLFDCHQLPPVTAHRSRLCPTGAAALDLGLKELEDFFRRHATTLAAVIIEPWVQGASGMNVQDLTWLQRLGHLCRKHEVLLILDEVFTGMGRLGSYYAFLQVGLKPDIVCIAKGLTGGSLPLAATLTTEALFQKFLSPDRSKALLHGHTFTGNATACAAALATLAIYQDEKIMENVLHIAEQLQAWIASQGQLLGLVEPRAIGAMAAWELPHSGVADYFHPLAAKIPTFARGHGLLLRTLGNTMYLVPPLCIKPAELEVTLQKIAATIRKWQSQELK